jgi:hypothetical protein
MGLSKGNSYLYFTANRRLTEPTIMGIEENKAFSNRSAQLISDHDFNNFEEVMASSELEGFKSSLANLLGSFPDLQVENTEQIW